MFDYNLYYGKNINAVTKTSELRIICGSCNNFKLYFIIQY